MKPVLLVVAGPNGTGKTTVTVRLREEHWSEGVEYLNADDVARDRFGDWNSPHAVLEAARWTDARLEDLLKARHGIAFANLPVAIGLADRVYVYDNSEEGADARLCLRTHDGSIRKIYRELPEWVEGAIRGIPRHGEFVDVRRG